MSGGIVKPTESFMRHISRGMETLNSHDLYNMNDKAKTTRAPSDAYMLLDSADRSSSTSATGVPLNIPVSQPYNSFRLQKPENMMQGGFTRLSLTEVRFPYAIPNITDSTSSFWVVVRTTTADIKYQVQLVLGPTSVGGKELADRVRAILQASPVGTAIGITWSILYLPQTGIPGSVVPDGNYQYGGFSITFTTTPTVLAFAMYPVEPTLQVYPAPPILTRNAKVKSLLDVMGFNPVSNWDYMTNLTNPIIGLLNTKASTYAPMVYTTYIDIVSTKLTYYQNVKDGTTKSGSRDNIICRLYIADETSTSPTIGYYWNSQGNYAQNFQVNPPAGSIPFVIHRQFKSPKQFMWEKNAAIDWVDIELYDDYGQPLYVPPEGLPDFQITFKATED